MDQRLMLAKNDSEFGDTEKKIGPKLDLLDQNQEINTKQTKLRILVVTWNLMGSLPPQKSVLKLLNNQVAKQCDLIVIGTQECERSLCASFFCESKQDWEIMIEQILEQNYTVVTSEVLQGLHLIALIKNNLYSLISDISKKKKKTGFFGLMGNKGGIQLVFSVGGKKLQFVNIHLQAYQNECKKRNRDLLLIENEFIKPQNAHEVIYFGDLNYRLQINLQQSHKIKEISQFLQLKETDQLSQQKELLDFLSVYEEGDITFPPTYKMSANKNKYNPKRIPGWTDRIFFKSNDNNLKLIKYWSDFEIFGSDHRPVQAIFQTSYINEKDLQEEVESNKKNGFS